MMSYCASTVQRSVIPSGLELSKHEGYAWNCTCEVLNMEGYVWNSACRVVNLNGLMYGMICELVSILQLFKDKTELF